ncbi:MAG: EamA family transporter [Oceanipulchritudo sp.]
MLPALLTAVCFAAAAVSARQSTDLNGALWANLLRLLFAVFLLGGITLLFWQTLPGWITGLFLLAGGIGFGLGGFCMMQTLQRLGSPKSLLTVESATAVLAGILSWILLEDALSGKQITSCLVIISGVLLAGSTWMEENSPRREPLSGYFFGMGAALFQALSLVLSREAFLSAASQGMEIGKFNAAFIRLLGGLLIAFLLIVIGTRLRKSKTPFSGPVLPHLFRKRPLSRQPLFWAGANALFGPVLGVTCWLWAVSLLNPGIVQSVAATAPLMSIPISRGLEWNRLGFRFYMGALIAISGITALLLW